MLISGLTVMAAMAGMFLAGNAVFVSFGIGTIIVVAVAMLGSVTVLPAMLSFLSRKGWTEKGRVPWVAKRRHKTRGESRVWGAILDRVLKRPLALGGARRRPAARAEHPGVLDAHGQPGRHRACRAASRSCRPTTRSTPRSPAAACRP